jgi:cephalosporin hydroxylase
MDLYSYFVNNKGKEIFRWNHYFPVYEKHFKPLTDRPLKILEIGILNGGSLKMWKDYFHPESTIVGIDIDTRCLDFKYDSTNINVRIGDQSDPVFLQSLIDEFGVFDLVIDDGSHHVNHVNKTFQFLFPKIAENGIYFIEDTHAAYWASHGGSVNHPESINNVAKRMIDAINADHTKGQVVPDYFTRNVKCMICYDSIIVFERGNIGEKIMVGYPKP